MKPDLKIEDGDLFVKTPKSRMSLLAICNAVYDPLRLVTSITIKLKIITLSVDDLGGWDSPFSNNLIKDWSSMLKEAISQDSLYFLW